MDIVVVWPFSIVVPIAICKKYISKNLEFSVKLFIFASTRKDTDAKRQKTLPLDFGLKMISIEKIC